MFEAHCYDVYIVSFAPQSYYTYDDAENSMHACSVPEPLSLDLSSLVN
jgi:hypothetical protein